MRLDDTTIANFWQRVVVGENDDDCWGWTGRTTWQGIAVFSIDATPTYAARFSWVLHYGEIQSQARIMRRCGNKLCANPKHLEMVCGDTADERIMARIHVVDDENSCWDWTGALNSFGYGKFAINQEEIRIHRYMYERENGPIPDGMVVMHICDRPSCCRPSHLILGTPRDNIDDMLRKNRQLSGERNPAAILNWELVEEIRARWLAGEKQAGMEAKYGVSRSTIQAVCSGRIWKKRE